MFENTGYITPKTLSKMFFAILPRSDKMIPCIYLFLLAGSTIYLIFFPLNILLSIFAFALVFSLIYFCLFLYIKSYNLFKETNQQNPDPNCKKKRKQLYAKLEENEMIMGKDPEKQIVALYTDVRYYSMIDNFCLIYKPVEKNKNNVLCGFATNGMTKEEIEKLKSFLVSKQLKEKKWYFSI